MRTWLLTTALLVFFCTVLPSRAQEDTLFDDPTAGSPAAALLASLAGAEILILGEVHDNAEHHHNQARIIRGLGPTAVIFEMLSAEEAALVNERSDRDETLRDALDWDNSGWPDWTLYQPVFEALGDTTVYGMALPRDMVSDAVAEGAAAIFGPDAADFGLTVPLAANQQQAREAHQQAVHCNMLPPSLLPGMVEAQRLRDAAFARATLNALGETGGPVVVITGTGHARSDWGMPVALRHADPAASILSLGQLEEAPDQTPPFDVWLTTEPAPREDPCDGLAMQDDE